MSITNTSRSLSL